MKEICSGELSNNGCCTRCGNVSQTTSGYCIRLIEARDISLREELIKFAQQFYSDKETCEHNVDQYLNKQDENTKDNT